MRSEISSSVKGFSRRNTTYLRSRPSPLTFFCGWMPNLISADLYGFLVLWQAFLVGRHVPPLWLPRAALTAANCRPCGCQLPPIMIIAILPRFYIMKEGRLVETTLKANWIENTFRHSCEGQWLIHHVTTHTITFLKNWLCEYCFFCKSTILS